MLTATPALAKDTLFGVAVTPAHFPRPTVEDIKQSYAQAEQLGGHNTIIVDWKDNTPIEEIKQRLAASKAHGLQTHLYLSPIALEAGRKTPAIPRSVKGNSFADQTVRDAYKEAVLAYAALKPDYLGLATEVNFLAQNEKEFKEFVSLAKETYDLVKEKYPSQTVMISFQWDVMIISKGFGPLVVLKDCMDVYAFTTYPSFVKTVDKLPPEYYTSVRKLLPKERIGFSEVGWATKGDSTEEQQVAYINALPELMGDIKPEFVSWALLHDVTAFSGEMSSLNHVGLRRLDGEKKPGWDAAMKLKF